MNKATAEALRKSGEALAELYNNSQIDAPVYYKGLVKLAAEYASVEEIPLAVGTLRLVSEDYIKVGIEKHMREDQDFRTLAVALAEMLVEKDVVYLGEQFNFSKPPAEA